MKKLQKLAVIWGLGFLGFIILYLITTYLTKDLSVSSAQYTIIYNDIAPWGIGILVMVLYGTFRVLMGKNLKEINDEIAD